MLGLLFLVGGAGAGGTEEFSVSHTIDQLAWKPTFPQQLCYGCASAFSRTVGEWLCISRIPIEKCDVQSSQSKRNPPAKSYHPWFRGCTCGVLELRRVYKGIT